MTKGMSIRQKIIRSAMVLAGLRIIYALLKAVFMSIPFTRNAILAIGASGGWSKLKEITGGFLTNIGLAKLAELKTGLFLKVQSLPQLLAKPSPVFGLTWGRIGLLILVIIILFMLRKLLLRGIKVINRSLNPVKQVASDALKIIKNINWNVEVGSVSRLKNKDVTLVRLIKSDGSEEMLVDLTNGEETLTNRLTLVPEEGFVSVYAFNYKVMTLNKGDDWRRVRDTNWFIKLL